MRGPSTFDKCMLTFGIPSRVSEDLQLTFVAGKMGAILGGCECA